MKRIFRVSFAVIHLMIISGCAKAQTELLGGPCEGCEAVFEYGNRVLTSADTLPEFDSVGERIKISGIVYQKDERTPARDIILYIYHTNEEGVYPTLGNERNWSRRHGYLRGWVKTNQFGEYTFYTQKPSGYGREEAHIHLMLLEPDGSYYYLENYWFSDHPDSRTRRPRGGTSGILKLQPEEGILTAKRDLILRKNL